MKHIFCVALLVTLQLLHLSCGNQNSPKAENGTHITFWHSFVSSTIPSLNLLLEKFHQEHPDIHITAQYIPTGDALIQKLITAIQSKTAPDISWIHADYLSDLVEADAIYKMSTFIKGEDGIADSVIQDIYPALLKYSSWQDTLYSLPMEATNLGLIYNKDHFRQAGLDAEKPPKNWEELKSFAKKLTIDKNNDGRNDQLGFFTPIYPASGPRNGWMVWQWMPFIWQAGGYLITEDQTRVLFNSEAGVQALTLWQELYDAAKMSTFTTDYDVAFAAGRLSMAMDGPWNLPRFRDLLKNIDWAVAPLPEGPEKRATVAGGEYLAIFKQSQNPDAAWKFVKWMIRPDIQAFWSMNSGYLPVRKSTLENPDYQAFLAENPNLKAYVDQMKVAQAQRSIDFHTLEIFRNMAVALEKATLGGADPKAALDEAASKCNDLLESVPKLQAKRALETDMRSSLD